MKGSGVLKILSETVVQSAIKGAITGAITSTTIELIRLGLDPKHDRFKWENVLVGAAVGSIMGAISKFYELKL